MYLLLELLYVRPEVEVVASDIGIGKLCKFGVGVCWLLGVYEGTRYIIGVWGTRVRYHEAAASRSLPRQPRQQKVGRTRHHRRGNAL